MKISEYLFIVFFFVVSLASSQSYEAQKTIRWMKKKNISLNLPEPADGFLMNRTCCGEALFSLTRQDSIWLFHEAVYYSVTRDELVEISKDQFFKFDYYAKEVLNNGEILIAEMELKQFIWRNDSLFMITKSDSYRTIEIINSERRESSRVYYNSYSDELWREGRKKSIYPPKYQLIVVYYDNMFQEGKSVLFDGVSKNLSYECTLVESSSEDSCMAEKLKIRIYSPEYLDELIVISGDIVEITKCLQNIDNELNGY